MKAEQAIERCPSWCTSTDDGPHEHVSVGVVRSSVHLELLRYFGDDTTYVGLMDHMDGGGHVSVPLEVLLDLVGEARHMVAQQPR